MIKLTICDDEIVEISYLTKLINQWAAEQNTLARISTFQSAEQFLFAYEEDKIVDILLLDIEMKAMNGVE
ncbi:MAG: DNA-binding response regulator, partial [Firmicutes bacterium]|nr:DNA-binding response regulator [Bacillota bacterium]